MSGVPWQVSLFDSPCRSPARFCFYCLCPFYGVYAQRVRLLRGDRQYRCCLGPPLELWKCDASSCPRVPCLHWEALCCCICAAQAHRLLLMREAQLEDDCWDSTASVLSCCFPLALAVVICVLDSESQTHSGTPLVPLNVCDCRAPVPCPCCYYAVYGCMLTQQELEIDYRAAQLLQRQDGPPPPRDEMDISGSCIEQDDSATAT
jgi:hypothetical protein